MNRTDPDFPSVLRSTDEYEQMMADQLRREGAQRPAVGPGVTLAIGFALAFLAMIAVAFLVEVMP